MAAPFYNNIKSTSSGAAGSGNFTPLASAPGSTDWSFLNAGWMGLVRFEEGTDWELSYCYWSGVTLSRGLTQLFASSTGSRLTLTSAATAEMVADASELSPHMMVPWCGHRPIISGATMTAIGLAAATLTGTAAGVALATTNFLTEQARLQLTSATTANAQAGVSNTTPAVVVSTASGRGGGEFVGRFGCSVLPTGPRLFCGLTSTSFIGNTAEPSALVANVAALVKDSTDGNLQFVVNSNAGAGTKIDTGIALVANGWYEVTIWFDPGSATTRMLLMRLDTGAIYYGQTVTDVPANGSLMMPQMIAGLSGTTGTAIVLHSGGYIVRTGSG